MKKIKLTLLVASYFVLYNVCGQEAEEKPRKIGLSASFQTTQLDIMVPIWLSEKMVLAPLVSAVVIEDGGKDLAFGLAPKFYLGSKKLSPYVGGRIAGFFASPKNGDNTIDLLAGLAFGGEYFFDRQFSIGVEAQGNFTKSASDSNRFGNPGGLNFNTGAAISANVYF